MAVLALSALGGCDDRFPDYSYKMTVHAAGEAFSSVRHVEVNEDPFGVQRELEGEAVVIDHPDGTTYFALLTRPENFEYAQFVAGMALRDHVARPAPRSEVGEAVAEWREENSPQDSFGDAANFLQKMVEVEGPRDLPRTLPPRRNREPMQAWPMFVTFSDPADPRTVREVSPEIVGVERITIEITDEEVTTGIEARLPYGKGAHAEWIDWRNSFPFGDWRGQLSGTDFVQRQD